MNSGLVINLFGGPGSGKTTTAAELFAALKKRHYNVELVTEFAKDLIMQNNPDALMHQFYVTGVQAHRIWSAAQKMQVVVVDSPILWDLSMTSVTQRHSYSYASNITKNSIT